MERKFVTIILVTPWVCIKFKNFGHSNIWQESHGKLNFYYDDKQFVNNIFSMKTNFVYVFH